MIIIYIFLWILFGFTILGSFADRFEMYSPIQPFFIILFWPLYLLAIIFKR